MMTHAASDPSIMLSNINWQETTAQTSPGEYTPYGAGSCTAFVWAYYHALGINLPPFMGMAYTWAASANTSVQAGVIVVFPPGVDGASSVGHVGVVTAVNPDGSFNIVEGNFNGVWGNVRNNLSPAGLYFINPLTMNK
jgi:surface antigen